MECENNNADVSESNDTNIVICGSCRSRTTLEDANNRKWSKLFLRCGDDVWTCDLCKSQSQNPSTEYHACCTSSYISQILAKCVVCSQIENPQNRITWVRNTQNYWYCFNCYEKLTYHIVN